jgi:hypothetical protein
VLVGRPAFMETTAYPRYSRLMHVAAIMIGRLTVR